MIKTVYFDNAATTWPKPQCVIKAVTESLMRYGGNPGRGTHHLAQSSAELLYDCRMTAAAFFGASPENVVFTMNATHALNLAIKGLAVPGCHILLDSYAHNASYRPCMALRKYGCTVETYGCSGDDSYLLNDFRNKLRANTGLVVITHQSNICSRQLPAEEICSICAKSHIPVVLDASQSAGNTEIDVSRIKADVVCMPAHKGLYGPMGCGLLISSPGTRFSTLIEGGAGINSLDTSMPDELPERLEAGTVPLPVAAGMKAGIEWIQKIGLQNIRRHEELLSGIFLRESKKIKNLSVHGEGDRNVISFTIKDCLPSQICSVLNDHGICVRAGYHCAPLAHKTLGTEENGTVRLSFSYFNTHNEIYYLLEVLEHAFS